MCSLFVLATNWLIHALVDILAASAHILRGWYENSIMYQPAWSPFHSMYVTVSTLGVDTVSDQVNSHQQNVG